MSRYIQPRITLEKAIHARIRRIVMMRYVVAGVSTAGFVSAGIFVWDSVYQYASLLFVGNALTYWREILLSVTEALPFLATFALLVSVTLMLWSITTIYDKQKRYI